MANEKLLAVKNKIKNKNPQFKRQDWHKKVRLGSKWRKPKGVHSKIRHKFQGRAKMPTFGYRTPSLLRGLNTKGLEIVPVKSVEELSKLNKDKQAAVIPRTLGTKKKFDILKKSKEIGIIILNYNVDDKIKSIEEKLSALKKKKEAEKKAKVAKETAKKKEAKKPESLDKKLETDQDKKDQEKKEKDKVLTKRS